MKETTLIRNVLSLAKYQFVDVSLLEWSPKWRWKTLSSSGGITCITSRNTIVLKNDIRMCLPICLHALGMQHSWEQNIYWFCVIWRKNLFQFRKRKLILNFSGSVIYFFRETKIFTDFFLEIAGTSKSEMWLPLVNVDLSQKPSNSTPWKYPELLETRNLLRNSRFMCWIWTQKNIGQ